MGQLLLKDLRFRSRHGHFDFEREITANTFTVDAAFETNLKPAGHSDALEDALNYVSACELITRIMNGPPVQMVEKLLHTMGEELMQAFPEVQRLELRLRKHQPPMPFDIKYIEVSDTWQRA